MYTIESSRQIADRMFELWVRAPHVARHARAGQFAILRIDEHGESIQLTISAVRGEQVRNAASKSSERPSASTLTVPPSE